MRYFLIATLLMVFLPLEAQWGGGEKNPDLKPHKESLDNFQKMRFGMFVHWGPSSIRGTSSWGRGNHPYDFAPKIPIIAHSVLDGQTLYYTFLRLRRRLDFDFTGFVAVANFRSQRLLTK